VVWGVTIRAGPVYSQHGPLASLPSGFLLHLRLLWARQQSRFPQAALCLRGAVSSRAARRTGIGAFLNRVAGKPRCCGAVRCAAPRKLTSARRQRPRCAPPPVR
jgi:hypothetical protein